jgi:hypothetical protein
MFHAIVAAFNVVVQDLAWCQIERRGLQLIDGDGQ